MAVLTASVAALYYLVIFPAMETSNLHDGITFAVSAAYFGIMALLFYYVFEPALVHSFSKSCRFITHDEGITMVMFMNGAFIAVSVAGYYAMVRSVRNKRAMNKSEKQAKVDYQTAKLISLLKEANQIQ